MSTAHRHIWTLAASVSLLSLSLGVVPPEEVKESMPQPSIEKIPAGFMIDWEAHPEIYYFMEGTNDLTTTDWASAKLLKDTDASGDLSLGAPQTGDRGFFRLSLEGDPGAKRLRVDDDGDRIINVLEADKDWDAFTEDTSDDTDGDSIPDYFEMFHFGHTNFDQNHIEATDGLTLAEAYAHATDPNSADSDGDGWTDKQEIEWGWDVNYDQSRDDASHRPEEDFDADGVSNRAEAINDSDPSDSQDTPSVPLRYAVVSLGEVTTHGFPIKVANNGIVLLDEGYRWSFSHQAVALSSTNGLYYDMNNEGVIVGAIPNTDYFPEDIVGDEWLAAYWPAGSTDAIEIQNIAADILPSASTTAQAINDSGKIYGDRVDIHDISEWNREYIRNKPYFGTLSTGWSTPAGQMDYCAFTRTTTHCSSDGLSTTRTTFWKLGWEGELHRVNRINNSGHWIADTIKRTVLSKDVLIDCDRSAIRPISDNVEVYDSLNGQKLSFEAVDLNENGLVLGDDGKGVGYYDSSYGFVQLGSLIGEARAFSSSSTANDQPLRIITEQGLFSQTPIDRTATSLSYTTVDPDTKFDYWTFSELVNGRNSDDPKWSDFEGYSISDNGKFITAKAIDTSGQRKALLLIQMDIVPDYNRDGTIDQADRGKVTDSDPFRWWINDDDDIDAASGNDQSGGGTADYSNAVVDTERDLIDFFPVFLDLKSFLEAFDDLSTITVKLKHAGDGLKFVYTDLLPEDSKDYWYETGLTTGYGSNFSDAPGEADTIEIDSSNGATLSEAFLTKIRDEDKGVILLEGRNASTEPLVLEVSNSNGVLFDYEMPLSLSPVDEMFRHVNAAGRVGTSEIHPDKKGEPSNYPDSLSNGKHFAFVHGYNVSQDAAQGWHSEVFKRMHQMGSKAKFIGVTWDGDVAPDYHNAVYRAFQTSEHLASELSGYSNLTIAAHSLGNMVVSNAMENHGLNPDRYYLLNAAVALEAYNATQSSTNNSSGTDMNLYMTENAWKSYRPNDRIFTAHWYRLFAPSDARSELTWKDRFSNIVDKSYNFYSPGEDVVENANSQESFGLYVVNTLINLLSGQSIGTHAWVSQEIAKGNLITDVVFANVHGGWSFNLIEYPDLEQVGIFEPDDGSGIGDHYRLRFDNEVDANTPTDEQLAQFGFFKKFDQDDVYGPLNDANQLPGNGQTLAGAHAEASDSNTQWHLLAEAIPAMSYAAAANSVNGMQENYNMMGSGKAGWPSVRGGNPNWLHSDFKNISLNYITPMYQRMIDIGRLDDD